jgi:hypothetical protein
LTHQPPSTAPYWAALVSTVGLAAWLASRIPLDRPAAPPVLGAALLAAAVLFTVSHALPVVVTGQVLVALAVSMIGVRAGFLLHQAVAANVRAGVSSGTSRLSWLTFVPVSLLFGWVSRAHGVQTAAWLLVLITAVVAVLLIRAARGPREALPRAVPVEVAVPGSMPAALGVGNRQVALSEIVPAQRTAPAPHEKG